MFLLYFSYGQLDCQKAPYRVPFPSMGHLKKGFVVSHTHWDRAWYLPFESFRLRLVEVVDEILDLLETHSEFSSFTLDGQSSLLEDYLVLKPENKKRLQKLISSRRLYVGPWYTLPDLFLASGESLIRNLQIGISVAKTFGHALEVGYVPDSFGHPAQVPQILQGFGISSYIFMRGMSKNMQQEVGNHFLWEAPSGHQVLAINMQQDYLALSALGYEHPWGRRDGEEASLKKAEERVHQVTNKLSQHQNDSSFLLPNGSDHMPIQGDLPAILSKLKLRDTQLIHSNFEEFVHSVQQEGKKTYTGDLLGNTDHPILSNVYSARMPLKLLHHKAQSLLRVAESLLISNQAAFEHAWKLLLKTQAHDNISGCSVDDVHLEDELHLKKVCEVAEGLITLHLEKLMKTGFKKTTDNSQRVFLFNPHPFAQTFVIESSVLFNNPEGEWAQDTPEKTLVAKDAEGNSIDLQNVSSQIDYRIAYLEKSKGRRYFFKLQKELPPLGYEILEFQESSKIENKVRQDPQSIPKTPFDLVLEEDIGDLYSFNPTSKSSAKAQPIEGFWNRNNEWEQNWTLDGMSLRSYLTFEENTTRLRLSYTNIHQNARLRLVLNDLPTHSILTDSCFGFQKLEPGEVSSFSPQEPHYPGERPYPTRHQGDFLLLENSDKVHWIANRGLPEAEVLKDNSVAITLHRSVGTLSVAGGAIRACHAGPTVGTPKAQCLEDFEHEIAWGLAQNRGEALKQATAFSIPAYVQELPYLPGLKNTGSAPMKTSLLSLDNPLVRLSALVRRDEYCVCRIYNTDKAVQTVSLQADQMTSFAQSDLFEASSKTWIKAEKKIVLELKAHEIQTLLLKGL